MLESAGMQILKDCLLFISNVKHEHQENEQWFINWQDELNKISVQDMNLVI